MPEHARTTPKPLRDQLRRAILLAPWALASCGDPHAPPLSPEASASVAVAPAAKPVKPSRLPVIESVFSDGDIGYVIDGAAVTYQLTIRNDGSSASNVGIRAELVQGPNRSAAGSQPASCGGAPGVVPTGTCAMSPTAVATNVGASPGPLVPGPATLVVTLVQSNGAGKPKVLDTRSVAIGIYVPSRTITSIAFDEGELDPPELEIGSQEGIWYTATVLNDGPELPAVYIQGEIHQGGAIGGAGGTLIECSLSKFGPLPTGTCVTRLTAVAGADVGLQPGGATLVVYIYREVNGEVEEFDRRSVPITLVSP